MNYGVKLERQGERELERLQAAVRRRTVARLQALGENPRPPGSRKLKGIMGYRLRGGAYRVLYTVDDAEGAVLLWRIGKRGCMKGFGVSGKNALF